GAPGAGVGDVRGQAEGVLRGGVTLPVGVHVEGHRAVVHHQVRAVQALFGGGEDADLPPLGGVGDHGLLGLPLDVTLGVVGQVLPDAGGVDSHPDAHLTQVLGRADAG